MLYDDDKAKEHAADFKQRLAEARRFIRDDVPELAVEVRTMIAEAKAIMDKPEKTPEDIAMLAEAEAAIKNQLLMMQEIKAVLEESFTSQGMAYYEHVKKLAAEGDREAQKILTDLQPAYQAMLRENMNNNLQ
jgi:hypothetical protein